LKIENGKLKINTLIVLLRYPPTSRLPRIYELRRIFDEWLIVGDSELGTRDSGQGIRDWELGICIFFKK